MSASPDQPLNLSQLLTQLVETHPDEVLTPDDLAAGLRDRVWGGLLLVFAAINLLPLPPGTTTVTGVPLIVVTAQMAMGRAAPWFPAAVRRRTLAKSSLRTMLAKFLPWERRLEKLLRPRLWGLTSHRGMRVIGAVCLLLSVILWLPIPLGNHAPAFSMTIFALALLYRDGLAVIAGAICTVASLILVSGMIAGAIAAGLYVVRNWLPLVTG